MPQKDNNKDRNTNLGGFSILTLAIYIASVAVGKSYEAEADCKLQAASYLYYSGAVGVSVSVISLFFTCCLCITGCCAIKDGVVDATEGCCLLMGVWLQWLVKRAIFLAQVIIMIWGFAVIFPAYSTWQYEDKDAEFFCEKTPMVFAFVLLIIQCLIVCLGACICAIPLCCAAACASCTIFGDSNA